MIDHVRLFNSVMQAARLGSSGYSDEDEWNRNLSAVQTDLFNIMAPLYSKNFQVQDMLSPFVSDDVSVDLISGKLVKNSDYGQLISISVNDYPAYPINHNEEAIIKTSPIRKPSISNNQYYFTFKGNDIHILPKEVATAVYTYLKTPSVVEIKFDVISTDNSDYIEVSSLSDLEWPEKAFNFLYYLMLEKYGVDQRESLAMEYSQMGIQKEINKV